ncbi:antibiotic biosynthesis monooxygenase family protein [Neobacillus sp. SM06]|uniref:antibiotic biosynthesis monooxygenase family protein n=1 Tax=Neobacillus sp. SM06 TaxID=3422492 RepID=UPI003D28944B
MVKIYVTTGTLEYLSTIAASNPEEKMVKMANEDDALLLHETNGDPVFKEPRKYLILDSKGTIGETGFAAFIHVPVTDEGRRLFEYQFKNKMASIEAEAGFSAIRVLQPLSSQTYIVITIWDTEQAFQIWKASSSYKASLNLIGDADPAEKLFTSMPYVKTYSIVE